MGGVCIWGLGAASWRNPSDIRRQCNARLQALCNCDWVVYATTPRAGLTVVLEYLSRDTHRTAIGGERLQGTRANQVYFRVGAEDEQGRPHGKRCIALDGVQFIGRLSRHVLITGFKRVRHNGLLAPCLKTACLAVARAHLQMPRPSQRAREDAQALMRRVAAVDIDRCGHCAAGRWQVIREQTPTAGRQQAGPPAQTGLS